MQCIPPAPHSEIPWFWASQTGVSHTLGYTVVDKGHRKAQSKPRFYMMPGRQWKSCIFFKVAFFLKNHGFTSTGTDAKSSGSLWTRPQSFECSRCSISGGICRKYLGEPDTGLALYLFLPGCRAHFTMHPQHSPHTHTHTCAHTLPISMSFLR